MKCSFHSSLIVWCKHQGQRRAIFEEKMKGNIHNRWLVQNSFKNINSCKMPLPGLSFEATGHKRYLLQHDDYSGNNPHWFPGFLSKNSGMSPKRIQNAPGLVGSEGIRLSWTKRPQHDTLSNWTPEAIFLSLSLRFPLTPEWYIPLEFQEKMCTVTDCS